MIHILYKNKIIFFTLIMFLVSCSKIPPRKEPVAKVNERFLAYYGNRVEQAKNRHISAVGTDKYSMNVPVENTAYGRLLKKDADFLVYNEKNKPYAIFDNTGGSLDYQENNYGAFIKPDDRFDRIEIPKGDFEYYYIGNKNYNEVNNIELQESYDYVYFINKEIIRQTELVRLQDEIEMAKINPQEKKQESLLNKTKKGLQSLTERIKNLIK